MKLSVKDLFSKCDQIRSFLNEKLHFLQLFPDGQSFFRKVFVYGYCCTLQILAISQNSFFLIQAIK